MAFDKAHLAAMVQADGQTWWQYKASGDTTTTIDTEGYFNAASGMLQAGDLLYVIASDGCGLASVNGNSAGVVDITDITANQRDTD